MNGKLLFGVASLFVGCIAYFFYYKSIFVKNPNSTRPHIFSWFAWSIAVSFAFFAQIKSGGGFGVWATGFSALNCIIITIIALFRGEKNFVWTDWVCLVSSFVGIVYWYNTDGLILPIIIISLSDIIAFIPTYRRDWVKPEQDTPVSWSLNSFKYFLSIIALQSYGIATCLYPATLFFDNGVCAGIILYRRWYLRTRVRV